MSDTVIKVENLSKRYVIGTRRSGQEGLRHRLENFVRSPLGWLKSRPEAKNGSEEFWALKDVSFEIKQGDVVGVIGRNGAGKSTLLKILSRITEPTHGRVRLMGRIASLLEVGTGFHPELTGRENVFLNGAILGMSRVEIKKKFDEIVAFAETEKFLDTPVKRYSSGMYVRLAFAVAAHLEPEILIVDEVLAVGDAAFQNKCMGKMENVAKTENRTVLFVSHNLGAVRRLCSRGVALKSGQVISTGPITQVLADYSESVTNHDDSLKDVHGRNNVTIHQVGLYVNGIETESVASGETVEIRIKLDFDKSIQGPVTVGMAFENMFSVLTMINYSKFHAVSFEPKESVISATIENLPLGEGLYRLHLRILAGDTELYWNMSAKEIRIEFGDFFGTGVRSEENLCPWLQKVNWRQLDQ
jgi:lipopolysaccharide transport system ATP-binding protein